MILRAPRMRWEGRQLWKLKDELTRSKRKSEKDPALSNAEESSCTEVVL